MEENITTYGLIGNPIKHSLSPIMHNTAFEEMGVPAIYKLFPLEENEVEGFLKDLKKDDCPIFGLNVTVPYKEKVIPYLDSLSPFADKVKAVNTIVVDKEKKLIGYNTDGPGFLLHLTELGINTEGKRIAVLGAGGAARSIVSVLCIFDQRPESIKIYDIDKQKASNLINDLGSRFDISIVDIVNSVDDLNIEIADMLINATPLGMKDSDPCIVDGSLINSNLFVYDIVYNPDETKLIKLAKEKSAEASNGLGMLFYQGILAFQHWSEVELDEDIKIKMLNNLKKGIQ